MATATSSDFTLKPFFVQAPTGDAEIDYTATDFRALVSAIWPRAGVLSPIAFQVLQQDVVGWGIQVVAGWAAIGDTGPTVHDVVDRYLVVSETNLQVNLLAAGFVTNPAGTRTHRVYLAVYDKQVTGSTVATAKIVVTEDTTGAGAPVPTGVADYLLLAYVTISPGQSYIHTANCVDARAHGWSGIRPTVSEVTLTAGIIDAAAFTSTAPAVTVIYRNGQVTLTGAVKRSGAIGFTAGDTWTLGYLSIPHRPKTTKAFLCATGANQQVGAAAFDDYSCRVVIFDTGQIAAYMPSGNKSDYIYLDGITFDLDV